MHDPVTSKLGRRGGRTARGIIQLKIFLLVGSPFVNLTLVSSLTPAEGAARWWSRKLGCEISASQVQQIQPGNQCSYNLDSQLCLRPAGHPGNHRTTVFVDDQGRVWDLLEIEA